MDAHTWSQVYFPLYGWIDFEPSASFSDFTRGSGVAITPTTTGGGSTSTQKLLTPTHGGQATPTPAPASVAGQTRRSGGGGLPGTPPATLLVIVLLLAIGAGVALAWLRFTQSASIEALYARIIWLGRLAGVGWRPWLTPNEYLSAVSERLPREREPLRRVAHAYAARRYSAAGAQARWAEAQAQGPGSAGEVQDIWNGIRPRLITAIGKHAWRRTRGRG